MLSYETAFDEMIGRLRIPEQYWSEHPEIRRFVARNHRSRYVPEELLIRMNLQGAHNMSDWQDTDYARARRQGTRRRKEQRTEPWRSSMKNYFQKGA